MSEEVKEGAEVLRTVNRGEELLFRRPRWSDVHAYLALEQTLAAEKMMTPLREWDLKASCDRVAKMLTDLELGRSRYIFVDVGGRVVGRGMMEPYHAHQVGVLGIALAGEYCGRGVGQILMGLLEDDARTLGMERIYLDAWSPNQRALALYRKMGYVEIGRRPDWIQREDLPDGKADLVEMIKVL